MDEKPIIGYLVIRQCLSGGWRELITVPATAKDGLTEDRYEEALIEARDSIIESLQDYESMYLTTKERAIFFCPKKGPVDIQAIKYEDMPVTARI